VRRRGRVQRRLRALDGRLAGHHHRDPGQQARGVVKPVDLVAEAGGDEALEGSGFEGSVCVFSGGGGGVMCALALPLKQADSELGRARRGEASKARKDAV